MAAAFGVLHSLCTFKHIAILAVCLAPALLSLLSLFASPPRSHPLSISTLSWRFSHRFNGKARPDLLLPPQHSAREQESRNLERVLKAASMPNKTVIITTLNEAWATQNAMIDLFLESFRCGNGTERFLRNLIIVALDQKAYDRCVTIHPHCLQLRTEGVDFSGEKLFMTSDYLRMMWRRIEFLRQVLEEGYSFVFSDADVMWLRDPFPHLGADADVQIACDSYNGRPRSMRNKANGGFVFARANRRTVELYRRWYRARHAFRGRHDQYVFDRIKHDAALARWGLRLEFLDTRLMSGFCEASRGRPESSVTVHANCCYGLRSKVEDLRRILADWKRFASMSPLEHRMHNNSPGWSAPKACIASKSLVH